MSHPTWKKALTRLRTLTWVVAAALAPHAFAQAPPQISGSLFGSAPTIQLDPAAMSARLQAEMEKCRSTQDAVDVYEKVGCQTLDAILKITLGQHDAGFATFREALAALGGVGDHFGVAMIQFIMAETAKQTNRAAEAIAAYEDAIAALEELRRTNEPVVLKSFAFFGRLAGLPENLAEQAGPMMQMMQPMLINQMELMIRVSLATFLTAQERYDEAEPHLEAARPLSRNLLGLMDGPVLDQLGRLRERQGRLDEARELYEEAIVAAQRSGDEGLRRDLVARLMAVEQAQGGTREVHFLLKQGQDTLRAGNYQDAKARFNEALSVLAGLDSKQTGVVALRSEVLNSRAQLFILLGMPEEAAADAAAARDIGKETADPLLQATNEYLVEWSQWLKNESARPAEAADALRVPADGSSPALHDLARILPLVMSQDEEDMQLAFNALELMKELPPPWDRILRPMVAAQRAIQEERFEDASLSLGEMRQEVRRQGLRDYEVWAVMSLAAVQWRMGRQENALVLAREMVSIVEDLQGSLRDPDFVEGFHGSERRWVYQFAIELMARSGRTEEAFDMAERARARALLYLLGAQGAASGRQALDPIDVKTIQQDVLPPRTTLIAYYISGERIFAWIVDHEDVELVPLPMTEQEMAELICLADELGHGRARGVESKAPLEGCAGKRNLKERYFDKLVAPLLPHVRHEQVIFVPHGVLHYVPFVALRDSSSGHRLLETKVVSYAPSASVLRLVADNASPVDGRVLVMGDPTTGLEELPWARDEAWTVAALFKTEPLLGDGATESRLHREAKRVGDLDLLHLAAHGVYRPEEPRHSRIALAEGNGHDGSLSVEEVYDAVDLRGVNLVVLSACQTALGEHTEGDEIIGLTRAFLDAGSPTVVSSLWRVDDEATGFLMKVFYERLLAGASYAEALRAAQLETSAQADWTEPYYWAAFALTGDPKGRWNVEGLSKDTNLEPRSGELR